MQIPDFIDNSHPKTYQVFDHYLRETISYLCRKLQGHRVIAEQAGKAIEPVAERFELPYTYGDKLRYSGQYVLVAVALGRASVVKEGRSYMYSVK